MRRDVLELMAEELGEKQSKYALASFTRWDGDGQRGLDGMHHGRPLGLPGSEDIDRLAANIRNRRWAKKNRSRRAASLRSWRKANPKKVAAQGRRRWKKLSSARKQQLLKKKRDAYREKLGRELHRLSDPLKLKPSDLEKIADPRRSLQQLVGELGVSETTVKRWRRRIWRDTPPLPLPVGCSVVISAGTTRERHGAIVAVVPPGTRPEDSVPEHMTKWVSFRGAMRTQVSYVVLVNGVISWPRPNAVGANG